MEKIDEWGEQVLQYQNQCRKLPKALRDWQAYVDCRDTIDNFLEMLPLFQALAHKSMRERHWKSIMQITGMLGCPGLHSKLRSDDGRRICTSTWFVRPVAREFAPRACVCARSRTLVALVSSMIG